MRRLGKVYHVTKCDCCGKSPLSHTVEFRDSLGRSVFYGSECARQFERGIFERPTVKQPASAPGQLSLIQ